jgi:C4-dicarboxylate-specific signal transduction histidine kinase
VGWPAEGRRELRILTAREAQTLLTGGEHRYRDLFHFVPVALLQVDRTELAGVFEKLHADGVTDLHHYFDEHPAFFRYATDSIRVVEVNRRAIDLFGASDAVQLLGPATRIWSEAQDAIKRSMQSRFVGAATYQEEIKIRTFDGRIIDTLYVADFPEAFQDHALGLACLVDVSERVQAQETIARLQMEFTHAARVSMLGELTASIAHEVNQPLGAILTNGEATLRWLDRAEPDLGELRALATRAIADARRAADIIRRIRAMAVRAEPERVPIVLNDVVGDVVMFLRSEMQRHGAGVTLHLAPALPPVMADRVQLQQVLANLCINAAQAMAMVEQPVRQLTVRTSLADPRTVGVDVEDTGPGIPPAQLGRLFQSFASTKQDGMGIGLAICRSIIEGHGGTIVGDNLGSGGARFRFTLPVSDGTG